MAVSSLWSIKHPSLERTTRDVENERHDKTEGTRHKQQPSCRTVRVHVTRKLCESALQNDEFCSNKLVTSKYTALTFVPSNLFHQFLQPANLYFLLIALIQLLPGLSPTSWITTVAPLSFVLILHAVKEAYDDWRHHVADKLVNHRKAYIFKGERFEIHSWESIIVGDILQVNMDEEFPADMVILCSSDSQGVAYVDTAYVDGDTRLKIRTATYQSAPCVFENGSMSMSVFSGMTIKCEHPNSRSYGFEGAINLQGKRRIPVDKSNVLLRGATLRNTSWVLGTVVFTGRDTRVVRNMTTISKKGSILAARINTMVKAMFFFLIIICISLAIAGNAWLENHKDVFYLPDVSGWPEFRVGTIGSYCIQFLRFLVLLHEFIPISLYVTVELVNVVQCMYIGWDLQIYSTEDDRPAQARASRSVEELGQVNYVLADKTGTLTQNVMAFVQCSIGGNLYGAQPMLDRPREQSTGSVHLVAQDSDLQEVIMSNNDIGQKCSAFFTHLALCHNVYPQFTSDDEIKYQASSPDEAALVQGAAECGYQLESRNATEMDIYVQGVGLVRQTVLARLEYTSERKRMSIICRDLQGRIKLYCKGADSAILKRLKHINSPTVEATIQHIEDFSRSGYRTLCIAERELSQKEYESWAGRFHNASSSFDDRQAKLMIAAETVERDMVLLGVTAVEDKLQEGVAETITLLAQAGIKIWVLTGDKMETAVSIGLSCNLLTDSMHLFLLSDAVATAIPQLLTTMLDEACRRFDNIVKGGSSTSDMAVIIEGISLSVALLKGNQELFLQLCQYCRAVIFCRVSPIQKSQVTRMVRSSGFVIAAVGDGANDVGMIKEAQIGVGISGHEGSAAVIASDYSIAQFSFLARLLLVHGRWSYKRNNDLAMYTFYKTMVYVMPNFYYSFFSAYSCQSIYSEVLLSTYNLCWTFFPIMTVAILERDVSHCTAENNPQVYVESQADRTFQSFTIMYWWGLSAVWHSAVVFFVPWLVIDTSMGGETSGIWSFGTAVYIMAVIIANLKLVIHVTSATSFQLLVLLVAVFSLLLFLLALSVLFKARQITEDLDVVGLDMYQDPKFWLLFMICPIASCIPDAAISIYCQHFLPKDTDILREMEHGWRDGVFVDGAPDYVERIPAPHILIPADEDTASEDITTKKERMMARKRTWREVVNDDSLDAFDHENTSSRGGKRRNSGFQMVTRLSDSRKEPLPLHKGPTPPHRSSGYKLNFGLEGFTIAVGKGDSTTAIDPKDKNFRRLSQLQLLAQRWLPLQDTNLQHMDAQEKLDPTKASKYRGSVLRRHSSLLGSLSVDGRRDDLQIHKVINQLPNAVARSLAEISDNHSEVTQQHPIKGPVSVSPSGLTQEGSDTRRKPAKIEGIQRCTHGDLGDPLNGEAIHIRAHRMFYCNANDHEHPPPEAFPPGLDFPNPYDNEEGHTVGRGDGSVQSSSHSERYASNDLYNYSDNSRDPGDSSTNGDDHDHEGFPGRKIWYSSDPDAEYTRKPMNHLQRLDISSLPSQPLRVSLYNRRKPTRPNITPKKRGSTSLSPTNISPRKRGSTMASPLSMTPRATGSPSLSPSNISPRTSGSTYVSLSSSNTQRPRGSILRIQPRGSLLGPLHDRLKPGATPRRGVSKRGSALHSRNESTASTPKYISPRSSYLRQRVSVEHNIVPEFVPPRTWSNRAERNPSFIGLTGGETIEVEREKRKNYKDEVDFLGDPKNAQVLEMDKMELELESDEDRRRMVQVDSDTESPPVVNTESTSNG